MASSIFFSGGRSYLHLFLGAQCPNQWWWVSLGQVRWAQFHPWCLADSYHCMLFQGITSVPSLFWKKIQMPLVQGQKCSLPSHCTGPGSQSRFWDPGLVYFKVSYLCTSWDLRIVPCSRQLGSSINYLWVGGMVSIWPLPHLFSIFLVLVLNSCFLFAVICTGL